MDSRFSLATCLVLVCGVIAVGSTTAEAAGIGVHLRVHAQNIPRAVAGELTRMSAWKRVRRRHRDRIRTREVFSSIQRAKVRRSSRSNERST
jgi:hypothetical protein